MKVSTDTTQRKLRYVPAIRNPVVRTTIGFCLLVLSLVLATRIAGQGRLAVMAAIDVLAWAVSAFFTHKYIHKYPQRYLTYLVASHGKAAMIMAFFLLSLGWIAGRVAVPPLALWSGWICFTLADALVSVPRRRAEDGKPLTRASLSVRPVEAPGNPANEAGGTGQESDGVDAGPLMAKLRQELDPPMTDFIEKNLSALRIRTGTAQVLDDLPASAAEANFAPVGLLAGRIRLNDVRRLNRFLLFCAKHITMGGYLVIRYTPLENAMKKLRSRYSGVLYWVLWTFHFLWYRAIPKIPWLDKFYFSPQMTWFDRLYLSSVKRRNRALSKAETWGRLAFCGMDVVVESQGDEEIVLVARRTGQPVQGKAPSYYPVVALEKVGLDGEIVYAHKIRTMSPFSEFIQKRIFEDHGLAVGGKFKNDFRLTGLGKFLRRYWLDELPQVFDWLRGEVKLVGIRATSRHYLSLYPQHFLDRYIQVKPGLIPPIFDEATNSFDQIVEIEMKYLDRYWERPFTTDVRYLLQTFTDIVFRGVRSK